MRGDLRLLFGGVGGVLVLCFILFPEPSEMANFWIGCGSGNFQPSDSCNRMCRMLGNLTACCYGVDHAGRSACGCCSDSTSCPGNCNQQCAMVQIMTTNCQGSNPPQVVPKTDSIPSQEKCLSEFHPGPDLIPVETLSSPSAYH